MADRRQPTTIGDHPRSRGVYQPSGCRLPASPGSSPLARGLHDAPHTNSPLRWIIPARAGFTWRTSPTRSPDSDHPRSRGVYGHGGVGQADAPGSSPLARGLPKHGPGRLFFGGIIPARAGFTPANGRRTARRSDHPRSRGVYTRLTLSSCPRAGSSPLARGLPSRVCDARHIDWIIPARAGFTSGSRRWPWSLVDHPRSRGGYE